MSNRIEITILDRPTAADKKTAVFPSRRRRKLGRRRTGEAQIRFYDLGQVNHESLDAEPIWSDHPILKTPSYTTAAGIWGSVGDYFAGVEYSVESFADADYSAFTDTMFNYPVTEWTQRYRRIEGITGYDGTADFRYDMRFSLRDSTFSGTEERLMPERLLSLSYLGQATFDTNKETYLTSYLHYWHNDRNYAGYRDLDQLGGQYFPYGGSSFLPGGYFPYSTDDSYFKVTATNDPDASPVTLGAPTGSYDVFLMPQVGFFMAVSHSSNWKTSEVLGLCYQVMPRHLWPRYVEGLQTGTGGQYGSDSAVAAWLSYQIGRSGVQYSSWTYTGTGAINDFSYTETPGVPSDWTGQTKWGGAVNGSENDIDGYYYLTNNRGSGISTDTQPDYTTTFTPSDPSILFGNNLFQSTTPFLTAVIKKGGQFYYVWDISHAVDGFGNFSAFETTAQNSRFRLSRSITWRSAYGNPPQPKDGTGAYYL